MSLQAQPIKEVPEETARVARAAFPKGNLYLRMRDQMGTFFRDEQFRPLFAVVGQPALSPWRLALICILQFLEDLSDRQAAEAVRGRLDWKYLLGLELEDAGFDHSVLTEFRQRLLAGGTERELLDTMLAVFQEQQLLKKRGKQRSDSTHVLAAVRKLNRWEMLGETVRAALNELATWAPAWYERYERRFESTRFPKTRAEREQWLAAVGQDGYYLLTQLYDAASPRWLREVPAVQILRQVWVHQFYIEDEQVQLREEGNLPPSSIRFDSPYDPDAHYSTKRGMEWTGYKVHLTESCDLEGPHLITNVETTLAPQPDITVTDTIHQHLAEKDCLPKTHLADAGYVDADGIVQSQAQRDITLLGPVRVHTRRAATGSCYQHSDFQINWEAQTVTCPNEAVSIRWRPTLDSGGKALIQVRFSLKDCRPCPVRAHCTSSQSARVLAFRPQLQYEALQRARQAQQTQAWKAQYAQRAGIEGTLSQGVRALGLRQSRYIGLAKTHLQHVLTAAAINMTRVDAWLIKKKPAQTRVSPFAALRPVSV